MAEFLQKFVAGRSEEHTSELQSHSDIVCRLLLEKKKRSEIVLMSRKYLRTRINAANPARTKNANSSPSKSHISTASPFLLRNHFFFNYTATTEIYTLSLHDALPILHKNVEIITTDIIEFIRKAEAAGIKRLWLMGGAQLIDSFYKLGFIDEYIIT